MTHPDLPFRLRMPAIAVDSPPTLAERIVAEHNRERRALGLRPYSHDTRLDHVASLRVLDMVIEGYFGHDDPSDDPARIDGKYYEIMIATGIKVFRFAGENLWQGAPGWREQDIPRAVVNGFLKSPRHKPQVIDTGFDAMGAHMARRPEDGWAVVCCVYAEGAT